MAGLPTSTSISSLAWPSASTWTSPATSTSRSPAKSVSPSGPSSSTSPSRPGEAALPVLTAARARCDTDSAPGAFQNQAFNYTVNVTNSGGSTAHNGSSTALPASTYVGASPAATSRPPHRSLTSRSPSRHPRWTARQVTITWRAPASDDLLTATATAPLTTPTVRQKCCQRAGRSAVRCNPCGATAAGTGFVTVTTAPSRSARPGWRHCRTRRAGLGDAVQRRPSSDTITFDDHPVQASLTNSVSGDLCWATRHGGLRRRRHAVRHRERTVPAQTAPGSTSVDDSLEGTLPYTDGASLLVFYNGGGEQPGAERLHVQHQHRRQSGHRSVVHRYQLPGTGSTLTLPAPTARTLPKSRITAPAPCSQRPFRRQ